MWRQPPIPRPTFKFKTKCFAHQLEEWEAARGAEIRAEFWEQGTGKTKELLDQAAWLYCQGEIDAILVVAPNSVHRNWIVDQIPEHLPDAVREQTKAHYYVSSKAGSKQHRMFCGDVRDHTGLAIMAMSYEGFMTPHGLEYAKKFLTKREVFYILDESRRIKSPGIQRTKKIVASGKYGKYRRIATGTPVANGPFDVYAPVRFLKPDYWKPFGLSSFQAFKTYFGIWQQMQVAGHRFDKLVTYRCLDQLHKMLAPIASRVTKDEVLDLPPKLYSQRYFTMTKPQARLYREVRDEYIALLESGETITAPLAMVRQLRLRQVLSGYVPTDDGERHDIEGGNPRLQALAELCDDTPHQAIIWAHFRRDVDLICELLGDQCVRYDGATNDGDRAAALERFQDSRTVKFFVGNPAACGMGLTLHAARTVIYYANDFDLEKRQQSEDRAHRIGQEHPVNYIDLICEGTVDELIAKSQQRKEAVSAAILGDALKAER